MVDQVMVKFGGDTGQFSAQMTNAARTVRDTSQSVRDSVQQMNASLAQLTSQMGDMAQSAQKTAASTRTLESYANWAFALTVLKLGYQGTTSAISGMYTAANAVPEIMGRTESAVQQAARSFADYAKSMAYAKEYGPLVKVQNDGLIASYGRLVEKIDDYFSKVKIAKDGTADIAGASIAAAGAMDRFSQVAKDAGYDNVTRALEDYISKLVKIPGVTQEVAAAIQGSFGSIKTLTAPLQQALIDITTQMSSTKEQAQALAEKMVAAFRDPASGGMSLLSSLGSVNESLRQQFLTAQKNNDVQRMQATIVQALAGQERVLMDEKLRKLREQLQTYSEMGPVGRLLMIPLLEQIRLAERAKEQFEKQAEALERIASAVRRMLPDAEQLRQSMNSVVQSVNPLVNQMDAVNSRISTLRAGLQGSTGDTAALIRQFEGFRSSSYWDVNAYRAGYGSDTKTNADGSVERVTKDTTVTREDAERDLARRIVEFQKQAADAIGPAWAALSDRAKASITSVTYNYGHTPDSVVRGARSGDESQLAQAIRELGANPGRRSQEANNITSGTLSGATSRERVAAEQALAKELDAQRQLNQSVTGGTEVEKARAENIRLQVAGKKDEVAEQERIVDGARRELAETQDAQNRQRLKNDLQREEATLVQRKNELKKSELSLDLAGASNPEETLAKKKALYDFEQSLVVKNSAQWNQIEAQRVAAQTEYDKSETESKRLAAEQAHNIALRELEERRTILREQAAEGQISHSQLLSGDIAFENQRTAIERTYWSKLKELATEGTSEYKQIVSKMEQLDAEASARRQKTVSRDMQTIVRDYKQAFDQIGSSISSSLMSMIQGTEKFSGLLRNTALAIVQYFVNAGVKMVTSWLANEVAKTTATVTGEAARTGAVTAGNAARTAAEEGSAAASIATKLASVIKSIVSSAAETFAGVFGFLSPVMGPAAAGPAAGAMGAVMGMTSMVTADIGSWNVPKDRVQLVHENELIMPARESEAFRDMLSGGSGGRQTTVAPSVQFHVSTLDSRSFGQYLRDNHRAVLDAVELATRRGVHLSRK